MTTLIELCETTGLTPLDHLELDAEIPVLSGLQAQGDLLIVPTDADTILDSDPVWREVGRGGVVLLKGQADGNPHTLVADPDTCRVTFDVTDRDGLALAVVEAQEPCWLLHPEHGGTGIAEGRYTVRRQREWAREQRLVAD